MSSFKNADAAKNLRVEATLAACVRGERLSHAILVEGVGGTLAFAKKIAMAVVCESGAEKPCGVCRQCIKAEKDIHPDIIVCSGGDRARSFHVDSVRGLRQAAYLKPNDAAAKAIILENTQNMTVQAQNALLKIIEEPPDGVTFILTCENKAALLDTVLSRVSVFSLGDAVSSDSAPGAGASGADTTASRIIENLLSGSELEVLAAFSAYEKDRAGLGNLFAALRAGTAAMLTGRAGTARLDRDKIKKLIRIIEIIDETETGLNQNVGGLLMGTILSAKLKMEICDYD